ncbi:bifunctional diguanylate cyclase/phosphodiesterase [Ideonella sp.]|uniref:bifunctional diguanylate cyclase/phosphodiesterase n=1 Tax=Ideonella sp. TaxID=1929293 RepID=UPI003BB72E41
MSLIRQVWLLLWVTLLLAFAGAFSLSVLSARQYLETQVALKNSESVQSLAQILSHSAGDPAAMRSVLARQFEVGFYQRLRLVGTDGSVLVTFEAEAQADDVPAWFSRGLSISPLQGVAPVTAQGPGTPTVAQLEVSSVAQFAHRELWRTSQRMLAGLVLLTSVLGALAHLLMARIRRPLEATVRQAQALTERRFITVSEPSVPELRNLTRAMNLMVERLKAMFDEQAGQVDQLRRQANCDALTGVSNRAHFMGRLRGMLNAEDGGLGGALMLVRICDLQGLNRRLGRVRTDALLRDIGALMRNAATRSVSHEVGRLNGSDFVMLLSDVRSLREPTNELAAALRDLLGRQGDAAAVVGAVRWWHGAPLSSLMAAADHALAHAEARGAFAVELDDSGDGITLGEDAWRSRLLNALQGERASLVEFPVIDLNGEVVHRECPLRLQFDSHSAPVPAAQWLPMARRAELTARLDLTAMALALQAIEVDNIPRAVHVCPASLRDSSLVPQLRALLEGHVAEAPGLWLEVAEAGALREIKLLRELVKMAHARGARVGLEHAGEHLSDPAVLLEAGLDFVKLDASLVDGVAEDEARCQHVALIVRMLHGIGIKVYAEGVQRTEDAKALWQTGMDGLSGPIASR